VSAYLHLGFIPQLAGLRRHDGHSIVLRHLGMGAGSDLVLATGAVNTGVRIIGNHPLVNTLD
jgi:hypothetical protein